MQKRLAYLTTALCAAALAAPAEASPAQVSDRLSADGTGIVITSLPPGATKLHIAVMSDLQGDGISYLDVPASQTRYEASPATPVVDVQAFSATGPIGGWAGRLQTAPLASRPAPAEQPASAERPAKEPRAPLSQALPQAAAAIGSAPAAEANRAAAEEAAEASAEEPAAGIRQRAPMAVGLDAGGWSWASAVKDFSGAVGYLRSSYRHYDSDSQMALLAKYGVTLMPLFGEGGTLSGFDNAAFVSEVVSWFKRYGKGGSFWAGRPVDLGATTCELVNEPGNPYFYSDYANHLLYAQLTKKVKAALTANFPLAVRPKLLVSYDGGFNGSEYGRAIFAAGAVADGVTVHPYGGRNNREQSALGNRSRVTQAHAETGLPVYVTEIGWPTATGKQPTGDSLQWTEQQQAENITDFVRWAAGLGYVRAVIDFNYADYGSNDWYGIVNSTGTRHKLSYAALKAAAARY